MDQHNWAGNYQYGAASIHTPETLAQIQELVRRSGKVKALGTRHSFNGIADTTQTLISLERFDQIVELDRERCTVTVEAGIRYGPLCQALHDEGFALHNLASLLHISVAGACATATHGSGDGSGNLATAVSALELVTGSGELLRLCRDKDGDRFQGAVVGLGGLGVVISLTLDLVPAFAMRQDVYENLPLEQLKAHFEEIVASAYSVSLFTDWQGGQCNQVWLKRRISDGVEAADPEPTFFGARRQTHPLHPLASLSAENCTEQMGIAGPWFERLPTSAWTICQAAAKSCRANTLCCAGTLWRPCTPSRNCGNRWPRCFISRRCAPSLRTGSG
jgi:xylitol oxidase